MTSVIGRDDDSGMVEDLEPEPSFSMGPKRPRDRWNIYITKCDTYDVRVGVKTGKGKVREFSTSNNNSPVKVPFGTPTNWQFCKQSKQLCCHGLYCRI